MVSGPDLQFAIALIVAFAAGWILRGRLEQRTADRSLRTALQRPPRPSPPELESELHRLLRARKKIQAVKAYKEHHRTGLREAKQAVDAIERDLTRLP
jgi:hypothetical protein